MIKISFFLFFVVILYAMLETAFKKSILDFLFKLKIKIFCWLMIAIMFILASCSPNDLKNAVILASNGMIPDNELIPGNFYRANGTLIVFVKVDSVHNDSVYYHYDDGYLLGKNKFANSKDWFNINFVPRDTNVSDI